MIARGAARMGAARLDVDAEREGIGNQRVDRRAVDERAAHCRVGEPDNRLERGGLAGTVGPEEARDRTRAHTERQVVDRRHVAIALRQALHRDRRGNLSVCHEKRIGRAGLAVIGSQTEL
jgi:hypothetical protein